MGTLSKWDNIKQTSTCEILQNFAIFIVRKVGEQFTDSSPMKCGTCSKFVSSFNTQRHLGPTSSSRNLTERLLEKMIWANSISPLLICWTGVFWCKIMFASLQMMMIKNVDIIFKLIFFFLFILHFQGRSSKYLPR